jgi:hypothetical protein
VTGAGVSTQGNSEIQFGALEEVEQLALLGDDSFLAIPDLTITNFTGKPVTTHFNAHDKSQIICPFLV